METLDFLRRVWPQEGYYCIAVPRTGVIKGTERSWFDHHVYATIEDAARKATELDSTGVDVYYAISSLKQPEYYEDTKDGRKRRVRTKQNLLQLKTLFLEVDVGADKEYKTIDEALKAVKDFVRTIGWPLPEVVSSGYGLHLYWHLDTPIASRMQDVIADLLKIAADIAGFNLDRQALDCARVFRVVGTHNYKRGGKKPVELLLEKGPYPPKGLYMALRAFCGEQAAHTIAATSNSRQSASVQAGFENNLKKSFDPLDFDGLLRCKQIRSVVDADGEAEYGHWWHVMQVVRLCHNGRELCHEISQGGSSYNPNDVDKFVDNFEAQEIGPTLCSTFNTKNPGGCEGCPYRGEITTPAKLGRVAVVAAPPTVKVNGKEHIIPVAAEKIEVPNPPFPYVRREGGGIVVRVSNRDADGNTFEDEELIFDYDIYPVKRLHHTGQEMESTMWHIVIPMDGTKEIEIPAADLYDKRAFAKAVTSKGIYPAAAGMEDLRSFMVAYIRLLQQKAKAERKYHTLGWQSDGSFVLGDRVYSEGIIQHCDILKVSPINQVRTQGQIAAWINVLDLYNHSAFLPHQFAFFAGAGSIFTPFTQHAGALIWLHGHSGASKTSIQLLINSVYGDPKGLLLHGDPAMVTYNAKMTHIATLNNLPTTMDEATRMSQEEAEALSYNFTQGKNKVRANPDGSLREDIRTWAAVGVLSANEGIYDKLAANKGNTAAKALRVLELPIPVTHVYTKREFDDRFSALADNYGLAGHLVVHWAVNHPEELKALIIRFKNQFEHDAGIRAEERFWTVLAVCALTFFTISRELELHTMEFAPLYQYIVDSARAARSTVNTNQMAPQDILSEYINANMTQMLVTQEPDTAFSIPNQGPIISVAPRGELQMRMDLTSKRLYVAKTPFRDWCTRRGMSSSGAINDLFTLGIVLDRNTRRSLGQGTQFATGAVPCIEINTDLLNEGAIPLKRLIKGDENDAISPIDLRPS